MRLGQHTYGSVKTLVEQPRPTRTLKPHQVRAVKYCKAVRNPALFMEMRLGKTLVVIEWLRHLPGKILVVAPLSALHDWKNELEVEGQPLPTMLTGPSSSRRGLILPGQKWYLIGFEALLATPWLLANYRWDALIVDESTRIRNPKAKVVKLLTSNYQNADRRAILSGSPAPEGPQDYCEQFRFLVGNFCGFDNFWKMRNAYFNVVGRVHKMVPRPAAREKMREFVKRHAFVLSRKDVNMANERVYETRTIPMEPKQKKMMQQLEDEFMIPTPQGIKETKWVPVKHLWMSRLAGGYTYGGEWFDGKFKLLVDLLKNELAGMQHVVWFRFNNEIERAAGFLEKAGVSYAKIEGTMDHVPRSQVYQDFADDKFQTLLVQVKLGLYSLNLSAGSAAVYFSCSHSLLERLQSEDRIEHMEKKEALLYVDLLTEDTPDEDIYRALRSKEKDMRYYLSQRVAERVARRVS